MEIDVTLVFDLLISSSFNVDGLFEVEKCRFLDTSLQKFSLNRGKMFHAGKYTIAPNLLKIMNNCQKYLNFHDFACSKAKFYFEIMYLNITELCMNCPHQCSKDIHWSVLRKYIVQPFLDLLSCIFGGDSEYLTIECLSCQRWIKD